MFANLAIVVFGDLWANKHTKWALHFERPIAEKEHFKAKR